MYGFSCFIRTVWRVDWFVLVIFLGFYSWKKSFRVIQPTKYSLFQRGLVDCFRWDWFSLIWFDLIWFFLVSMIKLNWYNETESNLVEKKTILNLWRKNESDQIGQIDESTNHSSTRPTKKELERHLYITNVSSISLTDQKKANMLLHFHYEIPQMKTIHLRTPSET